MRRLAALTTTSLVALALPVTATLGAPSARADSGEVTIATFNASLNRNADGQLRQDLANGDNEQAQNAAETIQRSGADIVLVNEFDYDADHTSAKLFRDNYLKVAHNGSTPVDYPYFWTGPVNTGVPSGKDLNNDGKVGGPDDAFGFGQFPGQYGFVVYSKYPIKADQVRTFQKFLWKDMPGALLPDDPNTPAPNDWFSPDELDVVRLSSKTHADIPIEVNGTTVHVLASHPTPPSFDGPELRNRKRNSDEIRLWKDYVANKADWLYDDQGHKGGLASGSNYVALADFNSDPNDGDSMPGAIQQLIDNPMFIDPKPTSDGGPEAAAEQGGANATHKTDSRYDTADFSDTPRPGNLRVDYVLPNAGAKVSGSGIFWPAKADPLSRLTGVYPFPTSDHRLVWLKVSFPGGVTEPTSEPSTTSEPSETSTPSHSATASATTNPSQPSRPGLPHTGR